MPDVHATALLEGDVQLADDVVVGPNCTLIGPMTIAGTRLVGHVYLNGPLEMGTGNLVYPFACLGFAPQHAKYDPRHPGRGVAIGNDNVFRESATVHRAFTDEGPTRIGNGNTFMVNAHAGHDARVGDRNTFANNSALGGHAQIANNVILGGNASVHQFTRLGRGSMISGQVGVGGDVAPFFTATGNNCCGSVNIVGMRRQGLSSDDIADVRWVYATLYRKGHSLPTAKEMLADRRDRPMIAEILAFVNESKRICAGTARRLRGQ